MDNSLKLASCTEDFLKFSICYVELALEFFFHTWESSTEFRTKFRTFLDKWTEFLASDAGKGILQYSGMGRYWNFPGATWNLETIHVWYTFLSHENLGLEVFNHSSFLMWSIFSTNVQNLVLTQFLGTIFLTSNLEWSGTMLPFTDLGLNSDRIMTNLAKCSEIGLTRS